MYKSYIHVDENKDVIEKIQIKKTVYSATSSLCTTMVHLFVGNPFYKTPQNVCTQNSHYDVLDLINLDIGYIGRTNYVPFGSIKNYSNLGYHLR